MTAPISIRRPVTVTVWLFVSAACVAAFPLLLGFGIVVQALTGRREPLIAARLTLAYFSYELGALLACGLLWLAAGGGRLIRTTRFQLLHWRLLGWYMRGLATAARAPDALGPREIAAQCLKRSGHRSPGASSAARSSGRIGA